MPEDPFTLLALPRRFALEASELGAALRTASLRWHPDRFALAAEQERVEAEEHMAALNAAFALLQDPLARAGLLLDLRADDTPASPAFLMEMMERREAIEAAQTAGQESELKELLTALEQAFRERLETLGAAAAEAPESSARAPKLGALYTEATYLRRSLEELSQRPSRTP